MPFFSPLTENTTHSDPHCPFVVTRSKIFGKLCRSGFIYLQIEGRKKSENKAKMMEFKADLLGIQALKIVILRSEVYASFTGKSFEM